MSTAADDRFGSNSNHSLRRPALWAYLSWGSAPRHRASSTPTRDTFDPYEKPDRHSKGLPTSAPYSPARNWEGRRAAWMSQPPRGRYLRVLAIIVFLGFVLFLLAPGERRTVEKFVGYNRGPTSNQSSDTKDVSASGDDCTKPHSSDKPLRQYALMIDAGSTGSRIHVYRFNNCGPTPALENEEFVQTEKRKGGSGLSAYGDDPEAAAKSLDPLLEAALKSVPPDQQGCSPVAVKATAGLRKLGDTKSQKILDAVRLRLETVYPFPVVSQGKGGVVVMDGADEGVYAWITTNYLLGKIGGPDKTPTAAVFDLGGGSTQIVFEPTFPSASKGMPETLAEGDHKYALKFGGRKFELYQHSYLGYGLMEARAAMHRAVVAAKKAAHPSDSSWKTTPIENPCITTNMTTDPISVTVSAGDASGSGDSHEVVMKGPSAPNPAQCRGIAERILLKDAECKLAPCAFNGMYQPSLARTFAREDVYVFSYFYDRLQPLGMPESFTLKELRDLAARVCAGPSAWAAFEAIPGAVEELRDRPEHCLDLNFMLALLHTGYEMPIDREIRTAKKIKGNELGWCLGASLPLLERNSGWECKVKKIA